MNDLEVPMQDYVHELNDIDKVNVFFKLISHQTCHIKEAEIFQFGQIYRIDVIVKVWRQDLKCFHRDVTSKNHLSQICQYLSL
jgi:hypothetical protein